MNRDKPNESDFPSPVRVDGTSDVLRMCRRLRESLEHNHAYCPDAERTGLAQQLLEPNSQARQVLGQGFHRLVAFDTRRGLMADGTFDLELFLQYVARELSAALELGTDNQDFHPEEISQILKDEPETTLFCFVGIERLPYEALQRLRGFTQETHRCLFCGQHDFGRGPAARAEPRHSTDSDDEISLAAADDEHSVLSASEEEDELGPFGDDDSPAAADSGIKLVTTTVAFDDSELDVEDDEPISLELSDVDYSIDIDEPDEFRLARPAPYARSAKDSDIALVMNTIDAISSLPGAAFLKSDLFDDHERKVFTLSHQAALLVARRQYDEALEWLIAQEAECQDWDEPLSVCLGLQADIEIARGDWQAAQRLLERQQPLLAPRRVAFIGCLSRQAKLLKKHGQLPEALAVLQQLENVCREVGQIPELVQSLAGQVQIHASLKDFPTALSQLVVQEQVCRLYAIHDHLVQCLGQQAILLRQTGQANAALSILHEQQRVAEATGKPDVAAVALGNQAAILEHSGDYGSAESLYRKAEQLCRQIHEHELLLRNLANQAYLLSNRMNRHRDALSCAEEALQLANRHGLAELVAQIEPLRTGILQRLQASA